MKNPDEYFQEHDDGLRINLTDAPITHALHIRREEAIAKIREKGTAYTVKGVLARYEIALNELIVLTRDIEIAVYQLESGRKPHYHLPDLPPEQPA